MRSRTSTPGKKCTDKAEQVRAKPYPTSRPLGNSARANYQAPESPSSCGPLEHETPNENPEVRSLEKSSRRPSLPTADLGMPTLEAFAEVEAEYLGMLSDRKRAKALISRETLGYIRLVLGNPMDRSVDTPQFRWWVRKMFKFGAHPSEGPPQNDGNGGERAIIHDGKCVAVKEEIYDLLCFYHELVDHGGRDRTAREVRKHYTWVPKELIAGFIKSCPTCRLKRPGRFEEDRALQEGGEIVLETKTVPEKPKAPKRTRKAAKVSKASKSAPASSQQHTAPVPPLCENPTGSGLGTTSASQAQTAYPHGTPAPQFHPFPSLIPWYLSSSRPAGVSGHGLAPGYYGFDLASRSLFGSFSGNVPLVPAVPRPQDHSVLGSLQTGMERHNIYDERVRLPSIHVHTCGKAGQQLQDQPGVTLPSLAQLFAYGPGHGGRSDQMHPRRPLEIISSNPFPTSSMRMDAHGVPYDKQMDIKPYVPQIDPALLPDGVHMLAFAAEAADTRDTKPHVVKE
ncbi:hypothetical protein C8Q78DRAFT_1044079 [Trametes maxima]|nr:hypothetical protein C8Q78DRAFT_1044079 [Trametes maxima]